MHGNLLGAILWGLIGRKAGASPEQLIPGIRMLIPEPVPEADRTALLSFMLLEIGAADWPNASRVFSTT